MRDRIPVKQKAGDQHAERQQHSRAGRADQQALYMLRRAGDSEAVDDDAGKHQIDQDVSERFAALRADLFPPEKRISIRLPPLPHPSVDYGNAAYSFSAAHSARATSAPTAALL